MCKHWRGVLFLFLLLIVSGLFSACDNKASEEQDTNISTMLAATIDEKVTGLGEITQSFYSPILTQTGIFALGTRRGTDGKNENLLLFLNTDGSGAIAEPLQLDDKVPDQLIVTTDVELYVICEMEQTDSLASKYRLCHISSKGELLDETLLQFPQIQYLAAGTLCGKTVCFVTDIGLAYVNLESGESGFAALPEGFYAVSLHPLAADEVLVFGAANENDVYVFDLAGKNWTHPLTLPQKLAEAQAVYFVPQQGGMVTDTVLLYDELALWKWNTETGATQCLWRWMDTGIAVEELQHLLAVSEERCVSVRQQAKGFSYAVMTPGGMLTEKRTVVTVGLAGYEAAGVRDTILAFNRTNGDVYVQLVDYTAQGDDQGLSALDNAIITNNIPDIIILPAGADSNNYIRKGLFADLYPLLDADSELSREDFVQSVLTACEFEAQLPTIVPMYNVLTAVGDSSVLGKDPGWTWEEFFAITESYPGLRTAYHQYPRDSVLNLQLWMGGKDFIDYEKGEAYLNTPQFISVLESCAEYPVEMAGEEIADPKQAVQAGETLLAIRFVNDFGALREFYYVFENGVVYKGFPSDSGSCGSAVVPSFRIGISSSCANKDVAWQFLREYLCEDYQNRVSIYAQGRLTGFPLRRDSLQVAAQRAATASGGQTFAPAYIPADVLQGESYWNQPVSKEHSAKFIELIETIDVLYQYDGVIASILYEESAAYYNGNCTVEEAAQLMQTRVQTYLAEQG